MFSVEPRIVGVARYVDPDGIERSKTFPRKLDAERFLVSVETDKLRGLYLDPSLGRVGFATYAIEWLEAQPVRPGTRHVYDSYLRNWILPALKGRALAAIRPTEIRGLIKKADAGLAPVTVRGIHNLLSTIFASAVADGYIAKNPCSTTAPPKSSSSARRTSRSGTRRSTDELHPATL